MVKRILHLEGIAVLLFSLYWYFMLGGNWLVFIIVLFSLDISMVGYLKNIKLGIITYNIVHNYVLALFFIVSGMIFQNNIVLLFGVIAAAHVGMDRMFGYGLKYPTHFKDTHMQKV